MSPESLPPDRRSRRFLSVDDPTFGRWRDRADSDGADSRQCPVVVDRTIDDSDLSSAPEVAIRRDSSTPSPRDRPGHRGRYAAVERGCGRAAATRRGPTDTASSASSMRDGCVVRRRCVKRRRRLSAALQAARLQGGDDCAEKGRQSDDGIGEEKDAGAVDVNGIE